MSFEKRIRSLREREHSEEGGEPPAPPPPKTPKKRSLAVRILRWGLLAVALFAVLGGGGLAALFYIYGRDLPRVDNLTEFNPPTVTRIYASGGELIAEYFEDEGYRTVVPLSKIPKHVIDAVLAAEDAGFRSHEGLDYWGMIRAFFVNLLSGKFKQGGSTITMQVVKTVLLTSEKTISRKVKEVILARRLEQKLSKDEILSLYLNQIHFGHRRNGIEEAARFYFGKGVERLSLAEAAVIAGLIKSPSRFSPRLHPQNSKERQAEVLRNLLRASKAGKLSRRYTAAEVQAAIAEPLVVVDAHTPYLGRAPYYADHVKQEMQKKLGEKAFFRGNLRIETACDVKLQIAAEKAVRAGLHSYDRRRGYRGPEKRLSAVEMGAFVARLGKEAREVMAGELYRAVVTEVSAKNAKVSLGKLTAIVPFKEARWARSAEKRARAPRSVSDVVAVGDVVWVRVRSLGTGRGKSAGEVVVSLEQIPEVQGALVAIDPSTREVLALVGGYDFGKSPFNRAVKARRQPGSSFKAIVYSAAIRSKRYTPATIVLDSPAVYGRIFDRHAYRPHNYDRAFRGEIRLRAALAQSLNLVAVKVADDIGIPAVKEEAGLLGIESPISSNLAVALGADSVTPLELANAYAVFASGGKRQAPRFVRRVLTKEGRVAFAPEMESQEVMSPEQAYVMTSMLRGPTSDPAGTARGASRIGYLVAGKTGTTNDHRDAWFMGFTTELLAGVWVGYDDRTPMGRVATGGGVAVPIWVQFMKVAMEGRPRREWARPSGIEVARIDPRTGLRALPGDVSAIEEVFLAGTAPKEEARAPGAASPDTLLLEETQAVGTAPPVAPSPPR
jgi:penicillin-binding protein 1A